MHRDVGSQIEFIRQHVIDVQYKGRCIGQSRLDFLIDGTLILELKAVEALAAIRTVQVVSYLRARNLKHGLLINFNVPLLKDGIKRVIL